MLSVNTSRSYSISTIMQNALIFSPCLDGHRQVYVFVMAQILEEFGFNIFIATNLQEKRLNSFYIEKLKEKPGITVLDTSNYPDNGLEISCSELLQIQKKCNANLTVFPEADNHIPLFTSQIFGKRRKLQGRVVGIFMRPFYYYRNNSLLDKLKFLKHFYSRWNTDEKLFYKFFLKRFKLLDVPLSIDENFVSNNTSFTWLPDVFQQYAEVIIKADEKSEQRHWIEKLKVFKEKNKDRFPFLYFGTAQERRGFDTLLNLAEKTGGCFIHCGLRDAIAKFPCDIDEIILKLKNENRFFETNEYIEDAKCIEYFFRTASHLILPYRGCYGSSGVMLQALEYGIPVLAPNVGVMAYRIEKYNLGITYSHLDINSLETQFYRLKGMNPKIYENDIRHYMSLQSIQQLNNVLLHSFGLKNKSLTGTFQKA